MEFWIWNSKWTDLDAGESRKLVSFDEEEIPFHICQSHKNVFPTPETENRKQISLTTTAGQDARENERQEEVKGKVLSCVKMKVLEG